MTHYQAEGSYGESVPLCGAEVPAWKILIWTPDRRSVDCPDCRDALRLHPKLHVRST